MTTTRIGRNTAPAPDSRRLIASCVSALNLCIALPVLAQAPISATPVANVVAAESTKLRYAEALQAYERNQWPQAFAAFMELANQGNADAARVAILMHLHGPRLYGQHFALTASQWALLVQLRSGPQRL